MGWTQNDIPNLAGKVVIVTGANSGLGLESSQALTAMTTVAPWRRGLSPTRGPAGCWPL